MSFCFAGQKYSIFSLFNNVYAIFYIYLSRAALPSLPPSGERRHACALRLCRFSVSAQCLHPPVCAVLRQRLCIIIHKKRIRHAPYFLPTPRECLRRAPRAFRRPVRAYFCVCASVCMSTVCVISPSGCAFPSLRKRLYDNAKEPLSHLRSAFSVASYSLSGHAIKPLPSLLMPVGRFRETFSGCRKGFSACSAFLFRDFPLSKFFTAV